MSKPRMSILDPRFKYRDSSQTDVRKTWRRARLLERIQKPSANVQQLPKRKVA